MMGAVFEDFHLADAYQEVPALLRDTAQERGGLRSTTLECATLDKLMQGVVVRIEGDQLVIEFDSPGEGFLMPGAEDEVHVGMIKARLDETRSTRPGPHKKGVRLRLVLRTRDGAAWPGEVGRGSIVLWKARDNRPVLIVTRHTADPS